jgi:1-phosphatidylinositol-4-phosphate 5-kinase
MTHH